MAYALYSGKKIYIYQLCLVVKILSENTGKNKKKMKENIN